MWAVIQNRFLNGSLQSNIIRTHSRRKNAKGDLKSNLISHTEMVIKHEIFSEYWANAELDWATYKLIITDDEGTIVYQVWYEMREVI